ncbi:hypothetical protein [Vibrio mediterranei]|uniref:SHOCT domain-containing protein n=1 Tax=Vibrio mediterranei TaxID=689 RepID=A0ABX5D4R3_9VIBR|nr:hypothetical protein [Vibrio mediterranei]PCD88084.1 hypothetical protein COR52_12535 [Vibrio mediterranei]PRQ64663.1 hypothetical protein COR51_26240 [Vibrio mediterranei]
MRAKLFNWIGGVSAVITIILAILPFWWDSTDLSVYLSGGDYVTSPEDLGLDSESEYTGELSSRHSLYTLEITNDGSSPAKDVNVMVPYDAPYTHGILVKNDKVKARYNDLRSVVIGELKPSQSVTIYIWSIHDDLYPSFFSPRNIVVSYDGGTATIKHEVDGSGILGYIDRYSFVAYMLTYLFIYPIPWFCYRYGLSKTGVVSEPTPTVVSPKSEVGKITLLKAAWEDGVLSETEFKERYLKILDSE